MITVLTKEAGALEFDGAKWKARESRGAAAAARLNGDEWREYLAGELAAGGPHDTAAAILGRDVRRMGWTVESWGGALDGEEPGGEDVREATEEEA